MKDTYSLRVLHPHLVAILLQNWNVRDQLFVNQTIKSIAAHDLLEVRNSNFYLSSLNPTIEDIRCAISRLAQIPVLLILLVSTAFGEGSRPPELPLMAEFKFEILYNSGKIADDIVADIYGDSLIVGIIPYQQKEFSLVATFLATSAQTVRVNDVDQQSTVTTNDFSSPVTYVVSSTEGTKTYKVRLVYTGLPLLYLYTDGAAPVLNKEDYVDGTIKIYPNQETEAVFNGEMEIRGRGNTTWTLPKKPYRIKLGSAASLLGMPSDKDWVLLANYSDKSLVRNSLAYYLGANMNFPYTPRTTHVDVVLNGVYQGNYLLGEHIKADKDRVNIKELEAEDTGEDVINGGYFLELDDYRDGVYFELTSGLPFVIKSPDEDELAQAQFDYIKNYMQQTEDAIFSDSFADPDSGYVKFINPETFIEWYWVSEVLKNIDARDVSSIFYYKDRDEKLNMGPLWDFDVAAGNASINTGDDPTSFFVRESKWFKRLFEDPAFKSAADARWFTFREELLATLPGMIDSLAGKLEKSQQQNFYKWDILNQPIWPSTLVLGSYQNEVDYLKQWLLDRIEWIDAQIDEPELTSFNLIAPLNETRILLSPGEDGELAFSWTPSIKGSSYKVFIDSVDGDFTNSVASYVSNVGSKDTTATIPFSDLRGLLGDNDSLILKWTAYASIGEDSLMASESFMIRLVNGVIGIPQLNSPADDEIVESLSPTVIWFKTHLAEGYDVQVSSTESFEALVVDKTGLADTTYSIAEQLTEQTIYYWRVRASNANGPGDWSEIWSFTTPLVSAVGDVAYAVSVFPNPTSRELYIDIPSSSPFDNAQLLDALGRTAATSSVLPGTVTKIDVSDLRRGIYLVILRGKGDRPVMGKVVLR